VHLLTDTNLGPYLTLEQATLLRYERTLPQALLDELGSRLRAELGALRTLVPEPLARDPAAFARRSGRFWDGSLLCADLSGFTALAEELAAGELLGIEELSAIINRVFGALLEELHAYGGAVLKFGGDALTCFFDAADLGPAHGRAAGAAALAMQRRMAEFAALNVRGRIYQLRLRIGVHSGRPFGAIVGDAERAELVVTGRSVNRVAALQERAAPGEVMVSDETLAMLSGARSRPRANGHRLEALPPVLPSRAPPLPPLPAGCELPTLEALAARIAELRPFLPALLPRHVLFPEARAGGEFRPVSALFINVTSLSGVLAMLEDMESSAKEILNAYYGHVRQVISRYGGEINKFDINSVGDKLLVVFGAPVAHEDDPQRAVEAALDLAPAIAEANQQLRTILDAELHSSEGHGVSEASAALWRTVDLSLRQRIGVATGNVYAGTVGSPTRREYTVIGQVVNLAARLMAAAEPGGVVVSPATARAVGEVVALRRLPPLALKGFAQPVAASAVLRRGDEPAAPARPMAPLVNRAQELAVLREIAPPALAGAGRLVAISGEPGIGKSRLIGAFWDELAAEPARQIALSARAYAQLTPYSVVRDLLTQLFELPVEARAEMLWTAIDDVVVSTAPVFAPLVPLLEAVFTIAAPAEVVGALGEAQRHFPLERLPQAEQRERLHDLIVALVVGSLQEQPLALLIDDLHWADASSLEVVQRIAQLTDTLPLLLVLSYRANALPAAPWLSLAHSTSIQLEGLDRAGSLALLSHLLDDAPAEGLEPVLERAQGSPFFLEALVRHLIDRGSLRWDEAGSWQLLEPLIDDRVPETIESVLAAQLDQLDEPTRELVQLAAVIGMSISYKVLAGVYSQARQPALHLMKLVRAGILVADEQEASSVFRFRQALLRDVAYQSILYAQRRELHRRVAERIEIVFEAQIERFEAELAHHYTQAEEYARAYAFALRAARSSHRQHALHEALAGYNQAWALAEQHPEALPHDEAPLVLEELANIETLAGRYDDAHRHYSQLLEAAQRGGAASGLRMAVLSRKLGSVREQQSMFDEALEWLHRARLLIEHGAAGVADPLQPAPATERAAALELSRICSLIGWVHFRRGEPERAQGWLDEALRALDEAGSAGDDVLMERARVYNRLGGVAWMLGNLPAARVYVERSLADFSALGDLLGRADAQNNLGILAEQLDDWQGAIASYRAALEANEQSGRRRAAAMNRLNLGAAHLQLGDAAAALPLLEQATAETHAIGDSLHEIMALRWLGRAQTRLARFGEAREALRRALANARQGELLLEQLDTYTALGELALAQSNHDDAWVAYSGGEALLRLVERSTLEVGLFLRFAARLEEQAGAPAHSAALRAESQQIFSALGIAAPPDLA
jgi:class 3 adenylate cyclase/tetratricopeptide (TPR) repeat protein